MNYMPEVLKVLGVEIGEIFNIKELVLNPYYFDDECILINSRGDNMGYTTIVELIRGVFTIEKLPWKPKEGEYYWCVTADEDSTKVMWRGYMRDFYSYNAGNYFRTAEEITPEIKERILREMKGKYGDD